MIHINPFMSMMMGYAMSEMQRAGQEEYIEELESRVRRLEENEARSSSSGGTSYRDDDDWDGEDDEYDE